MTVGHALTRPCSARYGQVSVFADGWMAWRRVAAVAVSLVEQWLASSQSASRAPGAASIPPEAAERGTKPVTNISAPANELRTRRVPQMARGVDGC